MKIIPLLISIAIFMSGRSLWNNNQGTGMQSKLEMFQSLCEKGLSTAGTVRNEYVETTGKVIHMITYKIDYYVNEKKYTEEVTTSKLPDVPLLEITYLPKNPSVATSFEPCKIFKNISADKTSPFLMYTGGALFLLGISLAWSSIKILLGLKV